MFGSTVLDVFIGLILIYLLYSLLLTIISEFISSCFHIRANMLKNAIFIMLVDDKNTNINYKYSLAENFYNYPSIKYLRKTESSSLPSYITKENFADTLFNMLREKGTGDDDMGKIDFCLKYNTLNIDDETKKHIINLFEAAISSPDSFKINLQNWFVDTMDRLNGWYKRRIRLISIILGFLLAVSFNVDSIKIAKLLSKDENAREQMVQMATAFIADSAKYKNIVVENENTVVPQEVIDSSLSLIKKDIKNANMLLGLGYNFNKLTKPDTIKLCSKNDSIVISKIVYLDSINNKVLSNYDSIFTSLNRQNQILDAAIFFNKKIKFNTEISSAQLAFEKAHKNEKDEQLEKQINTLADSIEFFDKKIEAQTQFAKQYKESIIKMESIRKSVFKEVNPLIANHFSNIQNINLNNYTILGQRNFTAWEKFCLFWKNFFSLSFFGFLITALALSLGAPFWFDLLKKLVSIRSVGVNPDEKEPEVNVTKHNDPFTPEMALAGINNLPQKRKEDSVDAALRIYGDTIGKIKGVIKVAQGYYKNGKKVDKCVQINVEDEFAAVRIKSTYPKLRIGENEFVQTNVLVTGRPKLRSNGINNTDRAIANNTLANGWGSYGCIVKNKYTDQQYILSCFHVLKGDYNFDIIGDRQTIIRQPNERIATKFEGYFTDQFDIAFAEISDQIASDYLKKFTNPIKEMKVTISDVLVTEVFINGFKTTNGHGIIVHDCWTDEFPYPYPNNKIRWHRLNNLIAISLKDKNGTSIPVTQDGDSGSIVFDSKGNALGIVVAGDKEHTFAIKMETIISNTDKTLKLT